MILLDKLNDSIVNSEWTGMNNGLKLKKEKENMIEKGYKSKSTTTFFCPTNKCINHFKRYCHSKRIVQP